MGRKGRRRRNKKKNRKNENLNNKVTTTFSLKSFIPSVADDTNNDCWKCSSLNFDWFNHCIYCDNGYVHINPYELIPLMNKCEKKDCLRPNIRGATVLLLKLLCVYPKIHIHSLPEELLGAIGNLVRYDLASVGKSTVIIPTMWNNYTTNRSTILKMV